MVHRCRLHMWLANQPEQQQLSWTTTNPDRAPGVWQIVAFIWRNQATMVTGSELNLQPTSLIGMSCALTWSRTARFILLTQMRTNRRSDSIAWFRRAQPWIEAVLFV